jgi:hypothetical protein
MSVGAVRQPNFATLLGLAWLVVVVQLLATDWASTARTLFDADDALRLVQVRNFLHGQGWFDLHEARLAPPVGYDSHWSRLIDAGLAGVFVLFTSFADTELAERLTRVVWPLIWLLPAIGGVAALAWRIAGRDAAAVALLMAVVGLPAFQQFRPGRIDHHNVQIALALLTLAAAAWSDRLRWSAVAAGALTGLALAIGLEGLPFLVVAGAAPVLRYVFDRRAGQALWSFGLALAASTVLAFLVTVAPGHWSRSVCDTMAINWMAPVVVAGLLLAAAGRWLASERLGARGGAAAGIVVAASAVFLGIEPRCLGGPYAMMDPILRPIWMAYVPEMRWLWSLIAESPAMGAAILAFPTVTMIAALVLARDGEMRRNPGFLLATSASLIAIAMTFVAAKMCNYALWMGMPLAAAWSLRIFAYFRLEALTTRVIAAVLLTPAVVSGGAIVIVQAASHGDSTIGENPRVGRGCFDSASYAQLARLPKGVIAANVDHGPFILALTPHAALAAPYHRLAAGIMAAHQSFALPPEAARQALVGNGVNYVVACDDDVLIGIADTERAASLWGRISAGDVPGWLERLPTKDGDVFTVYRLRPQR